MTLQARPQIATAPDRTDLDPEDWAAERAQAHRMLDDILDHLQGVRDGPVWRPMDSSARADFLDQVLPYATGNGHPRFMGWVHGGGNLAGMLAEMLAAGLNANLGGRDHPPGQGGRPGAPRVGG